MYPALKERNKFDSSLRLQRRNLSRKRYNFIFSKLKSFCVSGLQQNHGRYVVYRDIMFRRPNESKRGPFGILYVPIHHVPTKTTTAGQEERILKQAIYSDIIQLGELCSIENGIANKSFNKMRRIAYPADCQINFKPQKILKLTRKE